jgi:hypothetical protein
LFQVCSRLKNQPGTPFALEPQRFFFTVPGVPSKNIKEGIEIKKTPK